MAAITDSPEWKALIDHQAAISRVSIRSLFDNDPGRAGTFSVEAAGLLLDYSKNTVTGETLDLLGALADRAGLQVAIAAMFRGDTINSTEQRPALHVALRSPDRNTSFEQQVHQTLERMDSFVDAVTGWHWQGYSGEPITDVVNIGIGGSDLGPAMAYAALAHEHLDGIRCHFVSNVDPVHLEQTLAVLEPATTLFVVASKSFSTLETGLNAQAARKWFLASGAPENTLSRHFVAVTASADKAREFGIADNNIYPLWDWVGGRYSLWSAVGLSVALGTGMDTFRKLLAGALAMDMHFLSAPWRNNLPVLMALLDCWAINFQGAQTRAILPYSQQLHLFPAYLQQLEMESLGKSLTREGLDVDTDTGAIIWGGAGTNAQHSFHQFLHQGTRVIPADFIAVAGTDSPDKQAHMHLLANCFAQSQALMNGKTLEEATQELLAQGMSKKDAAILAPHKAIPGNRPSNTLLLDALTPESLGALIAAYEHKVYTRSVILGINAFDQFGVELGKELSGEIYAALNKKGEISAFDSSTNLLINKSKP